MSDEVRRTYNNAGIYKIQNKVNGKYYVGSAKNFKNRWDHHKGGLKRCDHYNDHLQRAYDKYGKDNFEYIVLENVELINVTKKEANKILTDREQFYLDNLDAINPEKGYNVAPVAGSCLGFKHIQSREKKKKLIEIAKNGDPRPATGKHELGRVFAKYTNPNTPCYDSEFDKLIKALRPDWFIDFINEKKKMLLTIAKNGDPRPATGKHELGNVLTNYINSSQNSYDPEFDKLIRDLRPDWFINARQSDKNKKRLLEMVKNLESKPLQRESKLGKALARYTSPSSSSFDCAFNQEIRRTFWYEL